MKTLVLAATLMLVAGTPIFGTDAHVHGVAQLNFAIETDTHAMIEILAPASDVYGFEHEPTDDAERQTRDQALAELEKQIGELIVLPEELGCKVETEGIETVNLNAGHGHSHGHGHGHHHGGGGHHHHGADHHHHGGGGHHHHGHDHAGSGHVEVQALFSVRCSRSILGTSARVDFRPTYPAFETIEVMLIGPGARQDSLKLQNGHGVIGF
ncbi:MAG: DUF2796 domain-containing protein [Acidobacteriota bacterium]